MLREIEVEEEMFMGRRKERRQKDENKLRISPRKTKKREKVKQKWFVLLPVAAGSSL